MFVVAITRWGNAVGDEIPALAPILGMQPYDARLRLSGPLPVIVEHRPDADTARELLAQLRQRGHGAVACDTSRVATSVAMTSPREFTLGDAAFVASAPEWGEREMPYADVLALIRATRTSVEETTSVTRDRKLSIARAALTGGLAVTKTVTKTKQSVSSEREQVLYMVRHTAEDPFLLCELRLRYFGLGERIQRTAAANFATLVSSLRERVPHALYDERLVRQKRKSSLTGVSGSTGKKVIATSNASANDIAAHLLVIGHLQQQL